MDNHLLFPFYVFDSEKFNYASTKFLKNNFRKCCSDLVEKNKANILYNKAVDIINKSEDRQNFFDCCKNIDPKKVVECFVSQLKDQVEVDISQQDLKDLTKPLIKLFVDGYFDKELSNSNTQSRSRS